MMKRFLHKRKAEKRGTVLGQSIQIGVLLLILVVFIFVAVWNTRHLNSILTMVTEHYAQDVTYQLATDIGARLESDLTSMESLAETIPNMRGGKSDDETVQKFLDRKKGILNFDGITAVKEDGSVTSEEAFFAQAIDFPGVKEAFAGESSVTYLEGGNLLFSTPVMVDGKVERILTGVRKEDTMKELIRPKSFEGNGLTCIVDVNGNVIISPQNANSFRQLDEIVKNETDADTTAAIDQMKIDLQEQKCGVFEFTSVLNEKLIMTYHAIGVGDWVLLTMIPADLVTEETDSYMLGTMVVIGLIIVILLLSLFLIVRFYQAYNKELERMAFTDLMTGGQNAAAFGRNYKELVTHSKPGTYAVALLNIRGFKLINEEFGIESGDRTIRTVYRVLEANMGKDEFVSRVESDHFFLCIKAATSAEILQRLSGLERKINCLEDEEGILYQLSFFEGAYIVENPETEVRIAQDRARMACQKQRLNNQSGCTIYSTELFRLLQVERELDHLFEASIENRDFEVYLQPKVDLRTRKLGGAEALIRWNHPVRGMISPMAFIPVLERSAKICRLDLYVFEEVCRLQERWKKEGKERIPVSVNLSRQHFKKPDFLKEFLEVANRYEVEPGMIEFELTESIFLEEEQMDTVRASIEEMRNCGFLCSLDDFGSGFSSLGMLKSFDIDVLKLDKRFFDGMSEQKTQNIISGLLDLADKLHLKTVAEGIETREQLEYLFRMHCDMVQGYIFSRPLPIGEFEQFREKELFWKEMES